MRLLIGTCTALAALVVVELACNRPIERFFDGVRYRAEQYLIDRYVNTRPPPPRRDPGR